MMAWKMNLRAKILKIPIPIRKKVIQSQKENPELREKESTPEIGAEWTSRKESWTWIIRKLFLSLLPRRKRSVPSQKLRSQLS
jgi:uncharacterized protein (DUF736 family)